MTKYITDLEACMDIEHLSNVRAEAYERIEDATELREFNKAYNDRKRHIIEVIVPSKTVPILFEDLQVMRRPVDLGATTSAYMENGILIVCRPATPLLQSNDNIKHSGIVWSGDTLSVRL